MDRHEFSGKLSWLATLTFEQRKKVRQELDQIDEFMASMNLIDRSFSERPKCPWCEGEKVVRWGKSHGLGRWRCKKCRKTFNALTGTPLARLRMKHRWLEYGKGTSKNLAISPPSVRIVGVGGMIGVF